MYDRQVDEEPAAAPTEPSYNVKKKLVTFNFQFIDEDGSQSEGGNDGGMPSRRQS